MLSPDGGEGPGRERSEADPSPPADGEGLRYFGPSPGWRLVNWRELWQHRELLWTLAVRDLKVRYRQTLVGVAWVVIQPVTTMAIFLVLFGLLGRQPASDAAPYGLVLMCGLLPWQLFAGVISRATVCLVENQALVTRVYFPRLVLPLSGGVSAVVDFAVAFLVLIGLLLWYGVPLSWGALVVPPLVALTVLAGLAVGVWLAALNAMYRDFGYVVPFLLQVGFFVSPVVYETDALIPERWRALFALNPMVSVIEGFRWALLREPPPAAVPVLASLAGGLFLLVSGLVYFRRIERYLADRI